MVHERSLANVKQLAFEIHTAEVSKFTKNSNPHLWVITIHSEHCRKVPNYTTNVSFSILGSTRQQTKQ